MTEIRRQLSVGRQRIAILATGEETNGAVGAIEVTSPRGPGPAFHVHRREDEAFYVLEGRFHIWVGSEKIDAGPGTWVYAPRDTVHGYQIESELGRHLSFMFPAGFEAFFEEIAEIGVPTGDPDEVLRVLKERAARYGVEVLGTEPSPGTR